MQALMFKLRTFRSEFDVYQYKKLHVYQYKKLQSKNSQGFD